MTVLVERAGQLAGADENFTTNKRWLGDAVAALSNLTFNPQITKSVWARKKYPEMILLGLTLDDVIGAAGVKFCACKDNFVAAIRKTTLSNLNFMQ